MKLLTTLLFSTAAGLLGLVAAYEPPTFVYAPRDLSSGTFTARDIAWADRVEARGIHEYARSLVHARLFDGDSTLESRDLIDTTLDARDLEMVRLEPRMIGGKLKAINAIAEGITMMINKIREAVEQDKADRSKFTVLLTDRFRAKYPHYNVVVCHPKHHYQFSGQRGKDWGHAHKEFAARIGGTIGYEIYWFKSGTFFLQGDGGFLNWSYAGNVKSRNGGTVIFNTA